MKLQLPNLLLLFTGVVFFGYGIICWIDPELPAQYAGLFIATHNGYAEMAAVYGGLQTTLGAVFMASSFLKGYLRPGLWLLFIVVGGIAAARGSVALSDLDSSFQVAGETLGMAMSSSFTAYTWGALAFESLVTLLAGIALMSSRRG